MYLFIYLMDISILLSGNLNYSSSQKTMSIYFFIIKPGI